MHKGDVTVMGMKLILEKFYQVWEDRESSGQHEGGEGNGNCGWPV